MSSNAVVAARRVRDFAARAATCKKRLLSRTTGSVQVTPERTTTASSKANGFPEGVPAVEPVEEPVSDATHAPVCKCDETHLARNLHLSTLPFSRLSCAYPSRPTQWSRACSSYVRVVLRHVVVCVYVCVCRSFLTVISYHNR